MRRRIGATGRAVSVSLGASAGIQALNVVTGVLLARTLGPHGRGELAAVLLWPAILAAIGSLGVTDAIQYHVARDRERCGAIVGSSLAIAACQSLVLVGVGALVVPLALGHFGQDAVGIGRLYLLYVPLNLLTLSLGATLNGLRRFRAFQGLRALVIAAAAAGLVALAAAHALTVPRATAVYLGANVVTAATAVALVRAAGVGRLRASRELVRSLLSFGVRSHLGNVSSLLNERIDQLLISVFLAPTRLGLYVVAVTLTSATALVGASVSFVALPTIAGLPPGAPRLRAARRLVGLTLLASASTAVPVAACTPFVVRLFFGASFLPSVGVARILLLAGVVLSTARVLGAVLTGAGRPLEQGIAESLALVVTFAGLAVLLPSLGLVGAGLASLAAYSVSAGWMAYRFAGALGGAEPAEPTLEPRPSPSLARSGR